MITEKEYISRVNLTHRKKFAQFFTPEIIADFMSKWVLNSKKTGVDILEPAFGLGVFSRSLLKINPSLTIDGYDIDETIYSYAIQNFAESQYKIKLENYNYITSSWTKKYDGIICNPPYLKFHDYDNSILIPIVNKHLNTHLNGFTNLYTLFLLKSISQLNDGGRLAYIIPSEFLNADYGVEVKRALLDSGCLKHLIIVDFTQCPFDDAITTACILLCEKSKESKEVRFSCIDKVENLQSSLSSYVSINVKELNPEVKWKQYYEDTNATGYHHLVPFSTFAKVSRGIATGSNEFFTFKISKIDSYNIPKNCFRPCICHSVDVQNQVFTTEDFEKISNLDKTVYLFEGCKAENDPHVRAYLNLGIKSKIDKKYLTASRSPWYAIENRKPSPIWVSVFNRKGLRFVRNKAGVYNLTTFHCIYNNSDIDTDILFAYLVTALAKEILLDNSRQYGNGLVKFEPNDLNKGSVVDLRLLTENEKSFVRQASQRLQYYGTIYQETVTLLDDFFRAKYKDEEILLSSYSHRLSDISTILTVKKETQPKVIHIKQLNFFDLFNQYSDAPIVENAMVHEDIPEFNKEYRNHHGLDFEKNCLISLVKKDNFEQYVDQSAKIYYTGKIFPSTVVLNKLYYFMPYLKGKGIRDLYLIKIARVGIRKEGQAGEDKNDFRLVFEIEFVRQLFDDYTPVELKIWRTYTDTTLSTIYNTFYNIR